MFFISNIIKKMGCSESRSADKQKDLSVESSSEEVTVTKEIQFQIYDCIINDDTQRLIQGLKNGLPINLKLDNFANRTILHIACEHGSEKVTQLLVSKGCDLEVQDDYGISPIFLAKVKSHRGCAEILKAAGAADCVSQGFFQSSNTNISHKLQAA
jgi:uncharacterized protein (UPF0262 family)